MKSSQKEVVTSEPFKIEWPAALDIKPVFEVKLSKSVVALVFATDYRTEEWVAGNQVTVVRPGYCVQYVNQNTGRAPRGSQRWDGARGRHDSSGGAFRDLLSVKSALDDVALSLQPVKKASSSEYDPEE